MLLRNLHLQLHSRRLTNLLNSSHSILKLKPLLSLFHSHLKIMLHRQTNLRLCNLKLCQTINQTQTQQQFLSSSALILVRMLVIKQTLVLLLLTTSRAIPFRTTTSNRLKAIPSRTPRHRHRQHLNKAIHFKPTSLMEVEIQTAVEMLTLFRQIISWLSPNQETTNKLLSTLEVNRTRQIHS